MNENSKKLIDDCFLRPIADARATNLSAEPPPSKYQLKTELQILRLTDDSQKMVMETLRSVHGPDFVLNQANSYKDRGSRFKKAYWEDRGTLMIQGVTDFSNTQKNKDQPEDRLRRYAIIKLESYGFATSHCNEALDHCNGDTDTALDLLFSKYMKCELNSTTKNNENSYTKKDLMEMREDEKMALESIYDKLFEEKELDKIWSLKFKINYLLLQSPSEKKKQLMSVTLEKQKLTGGKIKEKCKNFAKGHCRFGGHCRFSHIIPQKLDEIKKPLGDEDNNLFFLEIRFTKNTQYPYETPIILLKTTCHDFPKITLLKIARKLFSEAKELANDGMPSVYAVSELLQNEYEITKHLTTDNESFIDPEQSLFYVNNIESSDSHILMNERNLPSHHKMGSTGQSDKSINLEQISRDDQHLVRKFLEKQSHPNYKNMLKKRQSLPAWSKMIGILDTINKSQIVVISGETGCGKSTQVPQFILDNWLFESSKLPRNELPDHVEIICTQPRRLSAIGVSERVAEERNEKIGNTVGYQIRLENKISSLTRLTFCTTGILLRRLQSDPSLNSVSHVIIDEVHERSEESDFLLLIIKEILEKRKDMRLILMSATLNANLFSNYFGNNTPILEIPGRTFPVEQIFLEDILERSEFVLEADSQYCRKIKKKNEEEFINELEYADLQAANVAPPPNIKDENLNLSALYARYSEYSKRTCNSMYLMDPMKINPELIEGVLSYIVDGQHDWPREGSILVFLPGLAEIQNIHDSLCDSPVFSPRAGRFILVPLHSTLTSEEQSLVFKRAPKGKRKIVLSTNIAETSVTIDDCVFVVDYGLMKEKRFDANKNMESLDLVWESRANAMQRKGRAGRVMPGVGIHLFTGHRFSKNFSSQPVPEIHRVPLEQLLLRIKTLPNFNGCNAMEVIGKTLEPPSTENIISAVNRLQDVGAFDDDQNLTALGHHLSALPVDVRIGKLMLFGAIFQCLDSVLTIAACLSHKSPFVSPFNKRNEAEKKKREFAIFNSDHLSMLLAYKKWNEANKRSKYSGKCFADENFLSWKTLDTIGEMKYQFLGLLVSIGFVPIDLPSRKRNITDNIYDITGHALNSNGDNNRLLISLLCAALYPNVVKVLTPDKSYTLTVGGAMPKIYQPNELRFKTREDGFVSLHPSSVNSICSNFLSPFLIYQEKVKTSKIFIRECSMVPLIPLVFFAGTDLKIELHSGDFVVLLENGWIMLKAHTHEIAEMIQCLRQELIKLLELKIRDPCLNLLNHENGKKIISTIVFLVSRD